jgi:hypothetical protein
LARLAILTVPVLGAAGAALNFGLEALPGIAAFLIGASLGATELLSRYKESPGTTLRSSSGLLYMVVNGGAAALAYWLIRVFDVEFGTTAGVKRAVFQTAAAGLGAMAFFRSGVFNVRIGNNDVSVGPNLILESFLQAIDRHHDRRMAAPRSKLAAEIMKDVAFEQAQYILADHCLQLMQNVPPEEQSALGDTVKGIGGGETTNDRAKSVSLGLALLNVVGEDVLRAAVDTLGHSIRGVPPVSLELLTGYAQADPKRVLDHLAEVCAVLSGPSPVTVSAAELDAINNSALPDTNKAVLMMRLMVKYYGEGTVKPALASVAEIKPASVPPSTI